VRSYSGQCYVSQALFGRSANRGECAQVCRLPFNLVDATGKVIVRNKHLLSLKDLNQSDHLEKLLDAGVSSMKIEGRLKDVSYVKNVTAYYRKKLDEIIERRPEYIRASSGHCKYEFTPQLNKSFSRGFTNYFLFNRSKDISSVDTPKSLGEEMGAVKELRGNYLTVAGVKSFNNGDGVCFLNEQGDLTGFRINRVEDNKLFPHEMPDVKPRTVLYRNFDQEFEKLLARKSADRKINIELSLTDNNFGFTLSAKDEDGNAVSVALPREKELARTPQTDNLRNQLSKLGNTPFEAVQIEVNFQENWFIPASVLAELRRETVEKLLHTRKINYRRSSRKIQLTNHPFPLQQLTYLGNVMNAEAETFYRDHGVKEIQPAFEKTPVEGATVMFCKYCIRYNMGYCPVHQGGKSPYIEPYYLIHKDKKFRLSFDCKKCEMKVINEQ